MSKSPKLGLHLVPEKTTENFLDWRLKENGEEDDSNMMILDAAVGAVQDWQESINNSPITWGMLKNGLSRPPSE